MGLCFAEVFAAFFGSTSVFVKHCESFYESFCPLDGSEVKVTVGFYACIVAFKKFGETWAGGCEREFWIWD